MVFINRYGKLTFKKKKLRNQKPPTPYESVEENSHAL